MTTVFEARKCVQLNTVNGAKNALFNVGIGLFQFPQQQLDFLSLTLPYAVAGGIPRLCKTAGALKEAKIIIVFPCNNGIFMNTVQRAAHLRDGGVILEKSARKLGMKGQEINITPTKISQRDIQQIDNWLTDQQKKYADAMVGYISRDMAALGKGEILTPADK